MDNTYKTSHVPDKLSQHKSVEGNLMVLKADQETHYPVILHRLCLFMMAKEKDEPVISFIHRVRRDINYAEVEGKTKDQIAMLLIVGDEQGAHHG